MIDNVVTQFMLDPDWITREIGDQEYVRVSPDGAIAIPYDVAPAPAGVTVPTLEQTKARIAELRALADALEYFSGLADDQEIQQFNAEGWTARAILSERFKKKEPVTEQGQIYPSLSYLYILQAGALPVYKIGKGKPEDRVKSIKRQHCRHSLTILCKGEVDNALIRERALHTLFSRDRIPPAQALEMELGKDGFTEWFRLSELSLKQAIFTIETWVEETEISFYEGV